MRIRARLVTLLLILAAAAPTSGQEATPDAIGGGGRVDVPAAGFAVSLPVGWTVMIDTSEPREFTERPVLTAIAPDGESCEVSTHEPDAWNSLEEWAGTVLLRLRGFGPLDFGYVELATGDAVRIDLDLGERESSSFFLESDAGYLAIGCIAEAAPLDRWLSIAETLEVLAVVR